MPHNQLGSLPAPSKTATLHLPPALPLPSQFWFAFLVSLIEQAATYLPYQCKCVRLCPSSNRTGTNSSSPRRSCGRSGCTCCPDHPCIRQRLREKEKKWTNSSPLRRVELFWMLFYALGYSGGGGVSLSFSTGCSRPPRILYFISF